MITVQYSSNFFLLSKNTTVLRYSNQDEDARNLFIPKAMTAISLLSTYSVRYSNNRAAQSSIGVGL